MEIQRSLASTAGSPVADDGQFFTSNSSPSKAVLKTTKKSSRPNIEKCILKVVDVDMESRKWLEDPNNRVCDPLGSWQCPTIPAGIEQFEVDQTGVTEREKMAENAKKRKGRGKLEL